MIDKYNSKHVEMNMMRVFTSKELKILAYFNKNLFYIF